MSQVRLSLIFKNTVARQDMRTDNWVRIFDNGNLRMKTAATCCRGKMF